MSSARQNPFPFPLLILPVIGAVGVLGVLLYQRQKPQTSLAASSCPPDRTPVSEVPGVCRKSGVLFNEVMLRFLERIRPLLSFNPVINDGLRTPEQQARYMVINWQNHGGKGAGDSYLKSLYGSNAQYFIPVMPDQSALLGVIRDLQSRRLFGMSGHMAGDGLDFSVAGLNGSQRQEIINAGLSLGAKVIDEGDHIHMDKLSVWGQLGAAEEQIRGNAPYIAAAAVVGAVVIGGIYYATR